ncbi:hypothetical protein CTA2_2163 [Colletotrichum tanaceti]|uniref:Uncharacterized protein n=1 Tax=Colletotrichum tanaceti TaxID=1306861 RepID=A0A4U6X321_9PEZI|nr:hypothetical protein CTA2_2163 [Colletotrichum tanaceti]TKW49555.1 hypothetical protein CTA1_240 [Colletotrichum tanaceti]
MRFTFVLLLFLLTLTAALPVAKDKKVVPENPKKEPESDDKHKVIKGIKNNMKHGGKEIGATIKALNEGKKGNLKGLTKQEHKLNMALDAAIEDRTRNQELVGNKLPTLAKGLNKVKGAQKIATGTVGSFKGDLNDMDKLKKLKKTFEGGKTTNGKNLKEAIDNFH